MLCTSYFCQFLWVWPPCLQVCTNGVREACWSWLGSSSAAPGDPPWPTLCMAATVAWGAKAGPGTEQTGFYEHQNFIRCCHRHDCCYGEAEFVGCQTKTDTYKWTCEDNIADCDSLNDRCEKILCRCDRDAAKCLKKAPFKPKYALWPDFLCGCEHPTCNYY